MANGPEEVDFTEAAFGHFLSTKRRMDLFDRNLITNLNKAMIGESTLSIRYIKILCEPTNIS